MLTLIGQLIFSILPVPATQYSVHTYQSHTDNHQDKYVLVEPPTSSHQGITLIVYLHGMGSDFMEPIAYPTSNTIIDCILKKYPNLTFLSTNYGGKTQWGNDGSLFDISANIAELNKRSPINKIILIGSSMGGCVAMLYATIAPPQIKKRIIGVVSVEAAGDLLELYRVTGFPDIKTAMEKAFGCSPQECPELYRHKSFLRNLTTLNPSVKVFLVSARQDYTVPPRLQKELYNALKNLGIQVKLIDVDGVHTIPPAYVYVEGLDFVLNQKLSRPNIPTGPS